MTNSEIAKLFRNVAAALIIKNENRFRVMAYEKAADAIENLTSEVKDIYDKEKLEKIPGIGKIISDHLVELVKTGKVRHFDKIFAGISPAVFIFLEIPGIGPKRAYRLTQEFKLNNPKTALKKLKQIAASGKIAELEGWGKKSESELMEAISVYEKGQIKENRMNLPYADILAHEIIDYLKKLPGVKRVDALGSLRRKVTTIGDIDLGVATTKPKDTIAAFVSYPKTKEIIDKGDKGATIRLSIGRQVDLRVQTPQAYGAMLQYFTGSKMHNIHLREYALKKNLSLSEYGIKPLRKLKSNSAKFKHFNKSKGLYEFETEEDFYQALDMSWIPPEIREDRGEIEQGSSRKLPVLVKLTDIKGDLHLHSNFDIQPSHDLGISSLQELLTKAKELNYEYIGISDHNPSVAKHSDKQIVKLLKKRHETFEHIYYSCKDAVKNRVKLLFMLEVDINPEGIISLPSEAYNYLDAIIVSIHSSFKMSKTEMTNRIIKGLSHPKAKILGHPTGRLLNSRTGYDADWPKIFNFCKVSNKALEINAWPERLDLPDLLAYEAIKQGVKLIINTDSHAVSHMHLMEYGVDVGRRGWAENKDILNTLGYNEFIKWLRR